MKKMKMIAWASIFLMGMGASAVGQKKATGPSKFSAGFLAGYNRGLGFQGNLTMHNFGNQLPFQLRAGLGYAFINPGNSLEARRIFINNNTNGTPEKSGRSIDYRLDFLFPRSIFGLKNSYFVLGPRGSSFKGTFRYIGGNEEFDVISHQWGLGGGLEHHVPMTQKLTLVVVGGLDYYFPSTLQGHDTSYSPDNDNVNPRNDNQNADTPFTYKDANAAISQPAFMPYAMIGLNVRL